METSRKPRNIKLHNEKLVIRILSGAESMPASEIAAKANLSITSVMKILMALQNAKAVKSIGKGCSTEEGGKRPELFAVNEEYLYSLGCLVDTAFLRITLMDFRHNVVDTAERSWDHPQNVEAALDALCSSIRKMVSDHGLKPENICGIAVGLNGIIDADKGILRHPVLDIPWGKNTPVGEMLHSRLHDFHHIRVDNTGRYLSYALLLTHPEYADKTVFSIFVGTHTVGCLLDKSEMQRGYNGFLGEVGHMTILPGYRGRRCSCGSYGCFESLVSDEAVADQAKEIGKDWPDDPLCKAYCAGEAHLPDLFKAANEGSEFALTVVRKVAGYFAQLIRNVLLSCDPQIIVISGVYGGAGEAFRNAVLDAVSDIAFFDIDTRTSLEFISSENVITKADIGAAFYALERYLRHTEEI